MGIYNVLHIRARECPSCGREQDWALQFRYGESSLNEYTLGDRLHWGGRDHGQPVPGPARIEADGRHSCRHCERSFAGIVLVRDDVLEAFEFAKPRIYGVFCPRCGGRLRGDQDFSTDRLGPELGCFDCIADFPATLVALLSNRLRQDETPPLRAAGLGESLDPPRYCPRDGAPLTRTSESIVCSECACTISAQLLTGVHRMPAEPPHPWAGLSWADDLRSEHQNAVETLLESRQSDLRRLACIALGRIGPMAERSAAALTRTLDDDGPAVRVSAALALSRVTRGAAAPIDVLLSVARDPSSGHRGSAIEALGELGSAAVEAVPILKDIASGPNEWDADQSRAALGKIEKQRDGLDGEHHDDRS